MIRYMPAVSQAEADGLVQAGYGHKTPEAAEQHLAVVGLRGGQTLGAQDLEGSAHAGEVCREGEGVCMCGGEGAERGRGHY